MGSCYLKLKERLDTLSHSGRRIAQYIINSPHEVVSMPIETLAQNCDTSKSTVVRLCKTLGFKGYKDFCMQLHADLVNSPPELAAYTDILPNDSLRAKAESVTRNNIRSLENTLKLLDYDELQRAADAIVAAKRVDFYGCGYSGIVAQDAQNKFMRIGKVSLSHADPHIQIVSAASLSAGDVAVLISYTGETRDMLDLHALIAQTGATTVSLTRYGDNSLREVSDIRLVTTSLETLFRSSATGSRIGQLNLIDILFSVVASSEYPEAKTVLDRSKNAHRKKKTARLNP